MIASMHERTQAACARRAPEISFREGKLAGTAGEGRKKNTPAHFCNHSIAEQGGKYQFFVKVFNSSVENRVEMKPRETKSFCNAKV
jgi:hypothetical protein